MLISISDKWLLHTDGAGGQNLAKIITILHNKRDSSKYKNIQAIDNRVLFTVEEVFEIF